MQRTLLNISSLLGSIAILLTGNSLLSTLLSLRGVREGFSAGIIGLIMSMYFAGFIAGTFLCPRLIRRTGHIRGFAIAAAVGSGSVLLYGLWVNPVVWLLTRLVTGICMVGIYMVIESWLNTLSGNDNRGRVFALYMMVNLAFLALGQYLILAGDIGTLVLFALASMLFSLGLVPVALTLVPQPAAVGSLCLDLRGLFHTSPLGFMGCLTAGVAGSAFWALGPVYAQQSQLSQLGIAVFMSSAVLGGAVLQWPVGHWSDRADRRRVLMLLGLAGAAAALAVMAVPAGTLLPVMACMFCYGSMMFSIYPVSVAHANDHAGATDQVITSSNLLLVNGIGAVTGPLAAGVLMQWFGYRILPLVFCAASLVLAWYAWRQQRRGAPVEAEEKSAFVPLTRTTHAALEGLAEQGETAVVDPGHGADEQPSVDQATAARR